MKKWTTVLQVAKLCGWMAAARLVRAKLTGKAEVKLPMPNKRGSVVCRLNNSDLVIFLGTFLHGDCLLPMAPPPALVLDLGANAGYTALQFARQFPEAQILMVEPGEGNCRTCAENTRGFRNMALVRAVVSHKSGMFRLTDPDDIAMSQWYEESSVDDSDAVRGLRVHELLQKAKSGIRPVLIKMDIEEAEREIFQHDCEWLERVDAVLVEPHGKGTREIIETAFKSAGFRIDSVGEKILGYRENVTIGPISR